MTNGRNGLMECICGNRKEFRIGSSEFFIGTRKIIIHNLPHYFCSRCNKESYAGVSVDDALKYAYENSASELDWQRYLDYVSAFEDDFPDGVFVAPSDVPKVKLRKILNYCKEVGKTPSELTPEELEPFLEKKE